MVRRAGPPKRLRGRDTLGRLWQGGRGGQTASSYRTQYNKYRLAVYRLYLVADSVVNVTHTDTVCTPAVTLLLLK